MITRYYIQETFTKKFLTHLFEDNWKKAFTSPCPVQNRCYWYLVKEVAETVAATLSNDYGVTCKVFTRENEE
jgi:hypothetical protein